MLKSLLFFFAFVQVIQCFSVRSNIWWSRRNEATLQHCDLELDSDNPSLEAKICAYCFARCQQQFAGCLLTQMNEVVTGSLDFCQLRSHQCQKQCFQDERTSPIAEANWSKVVKVLRQFNTFPPTDDQTKH